MSLAVVPYPSAQTRRRLRTTALAPWTRSARHMSGTGVRASPPSREQRQIQNTRTICAVRASAAAEGALISSGSGWRRRRQSSAGSLSDKSASPVSLPSSSGNRPATGVHHSRFAYSRGYTLLKPVPPRRNARVPVRWQWNSAAGTWVRPDCPPARAGQGFAAAGRWLHGNYAQPSKRGCHWPAPMNHFRAHSHRLTGDSYCWLRCRQPSGHRMPRPPGRLHSARPIDERPLLVTIRPGSVRQSRKARPAPCVAAFLPSLIGAGPSQRCWGAGNTCRGRHGSKLQG